MAYQSHIYPWNRKQTNSLLAKDEPGKSKMSTFNLPGEQHAYGKTLDRDLEGVKEVSLTWQMSMNSPDIRPERDFRKLNKMAITNNLHRSEQFQEFRKSNDARVTLYKGKTQVELTLPNENHRYGKSSQSEANVPVKHLISNMFGNIANETQKQKYVRLTSAQTYNGYQTLNQFKQTRHTNASLKTKTAVKEQLDQRSRVNEQEPFKLSKFKNVEAKTQTYNKRPSTAQPKTTKAEDNYSEQYRIPTTHEAE